MNKRKKSCRFIHLIPYDGVGGVEYAARTTSNMRAKAIDFKVVYIYENLLQQKNINVTYNPFSLLNAVWRVRAESVDVLIVSLWRSSFVGVLLKLLCPRIKLVTFIHLERDVHFFDFLCTKLSLLFSAAIWADSEATIKGRLSAAQIKRSQLISFVTRHYDPLPQKKVAPVFIFWGRINKQKGLDRAIRIFSKIYAIYPDSRYLIIGPDGGALSELKKLCCKFGLLDAVTFIGAALHEQIVQFASEASFYLQTSLTEGMAMSVVESMQLGLLPVVTPVGEIATYCMHNRNAVIVDSDDAAIACISDLLVSDERYQAMRNMAVQAWKGKPLYRESVLDACEKLVQSDNALLKRVR